MSGIYLHIPFCKQACHYCNFHFSTSLKYKEEVISAMVNEIQMRQEYLQNRRLESIYFGGGTPSLLEKKDLDLLFNQIAKSFNFDENTEITLEANPDDLTKGKLRVLSESKINRLSIGVQTFHDDELKWMNRAHNARESESCIKMAQDFGFENLSADLIFGIPISSHVAWQENIEKLISYDVAHISSYALTVEEGTALGHFVKKGTEKEAKDEWVVEQFQTGIEMFAKAGYEHYEISNFAKPGKYAVHNSNYWKSMPYLGIGPSAHSYDIESRSYNIANNAAYIRGILGGELVLEKEELAADTKYNEYVMTRLRTMWGAKVKDLEGFGLIYSSHFEKTVGKFMKKDWVIYEDAAYTLSSEGKHYADGIASELFFVT